MYGAQIKRGRSLAFLFPQVSPCHHSTGERGFHLSKPFANIEVVEPEPPGSMEANYTAVVQQRENWWIGWIEEVPGVNSQGETREELLDNLRSALEEALEMNRADALAAAQGAPYEEVRVILAA